MATGIGRPLEWIDDELAALEVQNLRRRRRAVRRVDAVRIEIDGRQLVHFGSNDYLSLATDGRLAEAASQAARSEGVGGAASPLVTGRGGALERLEDELARFEGTEAAVVFPSGFAANLGTLTALVGRDDLILSDRLNHASLIDGCRLSRATVRVFEHGDLEQLESLLREAAGFRRRWIVTDSLFSMDGDAAPLPQLAQLAERYEAMLVVDEAHATGVFGARGRGIVEAQGVDTTRLVRIGTLSKALGAAGGFVAASQALVDWIANRARSYVFSTALAPPVAAAATRAVQIVGEEPHRRRALLERADELRSRLQAQGWSVGRSVSQIVPIVVGNEADTLRMADALAASGLFVPGIRPPSVPPGTSRLRISLCYGHTAEQIEHLLEQLARLRREVRSGETG